MAFENIPSVQVYQPPSTEDHHHHHHNESISYSSTPSIHSTSDPNNDDHTKLLDKTQHEATHTRNFSTDSAIASQDTDQNRSLLEHDQLTMETETQVEKEKSRPRPAHVAQPNPNPTPAMTGAGLPAHSRQNPRYYSYSRGSTDCGNGTPENEDEYDVEGGHRRGFNTGLPLWKSWTNARTEWRVGSRARVLKYYVGLPALGLLIVAVVVIIVILVVGAVRVAYV